MGIDPDKFWRYTLRDLILLCLAFNHQETLHWERTRNIELSSYASVITMNGKKAFKLKHPSDLYELPTDTLRKNRKPVKIDKERQLRAVNKHKKWLKKG